MAVQALERYAREFKNHYDLEELYEYSLARSDVLKNLLVDEKIAEIKANLAKSKSLPLHYVKCVVSRDQQQRLQADFGQYYNLDFSRSVDRESHAYAREHRRLSEKYIYDYLFRYRDNKRVPAGFDCLVKDVGGNPWKHVVKHRRMVHSCCPVCDANDSLRNANYHRHLADNDITDDKIRLCLEDHLARDPRVICETKSQYCDIKSKYVIFLHSAYNIGMDDIAMIMARANAEFAVAVVIFHEKVLLEQSGYIEEQEVYFRKYVRSGNLYIDFYFKGDHQNGYTHRFDTYIALVKCFRLRIAWEDGNRYYDVSCIGDRSCVRFYQIQQVTARVVPRSRVFRSITSKHYENKLVLYTWDYLTLVGKDVVSKDNMTPVRIVVPTRLFEDIYSYGLTLTDTRFLPKNLMNAGVSFNSKEVIHGQTIGVKERVNPVVLSLLVYSVYHLLYINNYEKTQLLVRLQRDENRVRGQRSWFSRFFRRVAPMRQEKFDTILSTDSTGHMLSNREDKNERTIMDFLKAREERNFDIVAETLELLECLTVEEELEMITTVTNPRSFTSMSHVQSLNEKIFPTHKLRTFLLDQFGKENENLTGETVPAVDCNEEQLNSVHVCDRDVVRIDTPGDGNCGFHALRLAGVTTDAPNVIRARLKQSRFLPSFVQKNEVADSLEDGNSVKNWATLDTFCLAAHEYGVQICVHADDECIIRLGDPSDKVYCVRHNGQNHWEAMVERYDLDPILSVVWDCSSKLNGMVVEPIYDVPIEKNLEAVENRCFSNDVSRTRWRVARSAMYDLESLGSGGYVCRSALKLREIFSRYPEFQPATGSSVLDICAGPGSWTQVLLEHDVKTCFGVTHTKLVDYNVKIRDARLNIVRAIIDDENTDPGDILDLSVLNGLITIINENCETGVSLVVADGMNCGEEGPYDADEMYRLMHHEILMAVFTMRPGANFIIKGIRPSTRYAVNVFSRLIEAFHTVRAVRLDTSRPTTGEYYLLCSGYNGNWNNDALMYNIEIDSNVVKTWYDFATEMTKQQIDCMYRVRALATSDKKNLEFDHGSNRTGRYRKVLARVVQGGFCGKNILRMFRRSDDGLGEYLRTLDEIAKANAEDLPALRARLSELFNVVNKPKKEKKITSVCGELCQFARKCVSDASRIYDATENAVINAVDEFVVRAANEATEVRVPFRNDLNFTTWDKIKAKLYISGVVEGKNLLHTLDTKLEKRVVEFSPSETALPPLETCWEADGVCEAEEEFDPPTRKQPNKKATAEVINCNTVDDYQIERESISRSQRDVDVVIMNLIFSGLDDAQDEFIRCHDVDSDKMNFDLGDLCIFEKERYSVALVCQDSDGCVCIGDFVKCLGKLNKFMDTNNLTVFTITQGRLLNDEMKEQIRDICRGKKLRIVADDDRTILFREAVTEYRNYLASVHDCETSNHIRIYGKVCNMLRMPEIIAGEAGNYGVYRYGNVAVKPKTSDGKYRVCFVKRASGFSFVPYDGIAGYELALVSDYCKNMLEPMFISAIDQINLDVPLPTVGFIQAAPGSGKTTLILREHQPANTEDPSLVILSTVEGKDDFRRRSEKHHKFVLDNTTRRYYRTAASYLLRPDVTSDTLYIDEALMHHPGLIIAIIVQSCAKKVYLLGDRHQIPFVNRNKTFQCKCGDLMRFFKVTRTLNTTYRCPQDVTFLLQKDYPGLVTARPLTRSLDIEKINTVGDVPKVENAVYLTFTQSEKEELSRHLGHAVSTVHEYQGKENGHVIVVRLSPREQDAIYNRAEYPRVAISRANTRTTYYTACINDTLSNWIKDAKAAADSEIVSVYLKAGAFDLKSGFIELSRPNKSIATLELSNTRLFSSPRTIVIFVPRKGYYSKDYGYRGYRADRVVERYVTGRRVYEVYSGDKPSLIEIRESLKELRKNVTGDISVNGDVLYTLEEQLLSNVFRKHYGGYSIRLHTSVPIGQVHPNVFHLMNRNGISGIPNKEIVPLIQEPPEVRLCTGSNVKFNIVISYEAAGIPTGVDNVYHNKESLLVHHVIDKEKLLSQYQMRTLIKAVLMLPGNVRLGFFIDDRLKNAYIDFIINSPVNKKVIVEGQSTTTPSCDIGLIQEIVRKCMPGTYMTDDDLDAWMVHNYDFELVPGSCVYRKWPVYTRSEYDTMMPVLNTSAPRLRERTSRETLLAYYKRNACVPQLTGIVSFTDQACNMAKRFVSELIDRDQFVNYTKEKIRVSEVEIDDWLSKQDSKVIDQIFPDTPLHDTSLDTYDFDIKRAPKISLNPTNTAYTALQTIVCHPKTVNAIFCVIFKQMKMRLLACLRKNVKMFCDVSPDDFAKALNTDIPYENSMRFLEKLEIDISKYDKSQREIALELEMLLMLAFGVEEKYVRLWEKAHIVSTLKCRGTGLRAVVNYQRKSGDASTFLGNTMFLMAVIATELPVSTCKMALFSGDDSLIYGHDLYSRLDAQKLALVYNLECKIFRFEKSYFCSKFLVVADGKWVFVPDPVKVAIKLGRSDLKNPLHLEEYRVSLHDNNKQFNNPQVCRAVAAAVKERYKVSIDLCYHFRELYTVTYSDNIHKLYYIPKGAKLDQTMCFSSY